MDTELCIQYNTEIPFGAKINCIFSIFPEYATLLYIQLKKNCFLELSIACDTAGAGEEEKYVTKETVL